MATPPTTYDGTISVVQAILTTLTHILIKAEESHPNAHSLLEARLYSYLAARLTDRESVMLGSKPTTFSECYERIETVHKVLREAEKDVVNQQCDVVKPTSRGPLGAVDMSGAVYAHAIALPNIYFHLMAAHGNLRKEGVPLGKMDYYQGFVPLQN
ncbi:hypothetical protein BDW59DRAFT_178277 [Aspergillus cavernicola]|uniref:Uncharacterized protein n=1 Tax=Aspergillus cavernicola TaxID=176166 RepID=A0ABR4HCU7_9EURO